jgi:hypothetical protein
LEACPEYMIYFAQQKVAQLYRQLPEGCIVARKASRSTNERDSFDVQLPPPGGDPKKQPYLNHAGLDCSCGTYQEALLDQNDMFQLRHVLRNLRRTQRLQPLPCARQGEAACPGMFYSICAPFAAEVAAAPAAGLLLCASEGTGGRQLRLFCEPGAFSGGDAEAARQLAWQKGDALPLGGVMLCLCAGAKEVAGLPLYLAIRKNK